MNWGSAMTLGEYILFLRSKGFKFKEDVIHFVYFGKQYTNASDDVVKAAIEITLKSQRYFDGSFYISLLENFKQHNIHSRKEAYHYIHKLGLLKKNEGA
ncbi:DUF6123 family protein [Heyndrickxia ginsengihumi]|nr:DUF6123 family protein [Heyndrickxia ginsengihumi]